MLCFVDFEGSVRSGGTGCVCVRVGVRLSV